MSESATSEDPAPTEPPGTISKTVVYYASFVALGLALASLGPTIQGLADQTQTKLHEISFLFMTRSMGYLIGSLFGGRLYDRLPGHPLLAASLVVMAVTLGLTPMMMQLWMLIGLFLVMGIAEGSLDVGGNTLLAWVHRVNLGPFMNGLHFFFGVGAFLAPIVIAQMMFWGEGIGWAYRTLALLILPTAGAVLLLPSPRIQSPARTEGGGHGTAWLIVLIALCFFVFVGAEVGIGNWIYTYAIAQNLSDPTAAAYLTSAFWGAMTLGRLLAIPLSTRVSPAAMLWGDLIGGLVSVGIILIWPQVLVAIWVGTIGAGLSVASMFASLLAFSQEHMTISGRVTGWFFVGSSTGAMCVPWVIGQFFESIGPTVTMVVVLVDLGMAVGVFAALVLYVRSLRENPILA